MYYGAFFFGLSTLYRVPSISDKYDSALYKSGGLCLQVSNKVLICSALPIKGITPG